MDAIADSLGDYGPALLACGTFTLALLLLGPRNAPLRAVAAVTSITLLLRYALWRYTEGVPDTQGAVGDALVLLFLAFEACSIVSAGINQFMLARTIHRGAEADRYADHPVCRAPVDVFIATYNESRDILERTLIGAAAIDHPDLRVWLLDDGARDWARTLAEAHGALYCRRVKGKHAKAGNVNNGLRAALATGRPPEFVLLLDADFVAARNILRRTLPLFHDPRVGIVQTPQYFFNPDPIQTNVFSPAVWPDEQRFFFNVLLPSQDAWGGAFCCGTSAVLRVAALRAIGGMATETVTEDMLTSFKLNERGFRTVYLDEQLSLGLAPEGIVEYITQRARWCLGTVQQVYTRWSFLGFARLRWIDRLNNFSSFLYWSVSFPFRLMMLSMPALWWWTGISMFNTGAAGLARELLPYMVFSTMFYSVYCGNRLLPMLSDVNQLVPSVAIMRSVATGLIRPWGQPFRVTPKGVSAEGLTFHWNLMAPFLLIAAASLLGVAWNLRQGTDLVAQPSFQVNVAWSVLNAFVLSVTCLACVDQPRRRREERFPSGERAVLIAPGRRQVACTVTDISVGGASLDTPGGWAEPPPGGRLWLDDGRLVVDFASVRVVQGRLAVRFLLGPAERAAMILKLFDVRYGRAIERVNPARAIGVALRRLFA